MEGERPTKDARTPDRITKASRIRKVTRPLSAPVFQDEHGRYMATPPADRMIKGYGTR